MAHCLIGEQQRKCFCEEDKWLFRSLGTEAGTWVKDCSGDLHQTAPGAGVANQKKGNGPKNAFDCGPNL
jgi:hypothetical protein